MKALKHQPELSQHETKFVYEVSKQKISEQELAKEFEKQKKKWDKAGRPVRHITFFLFLSKMEFNGEQKSNGLKI